MDGQHSYEINLKKDGLFINLSSDDVYFISKQMDKWFRILLDDSYVPVSLPQRPQPAAVTEAAPEVALPAAVVPPAPVEEAPVAPPPPPVEAVAPAQPEPVAVQPQPQIQPVVEAPLPAPQPEPQPVAIPDPPPAVAATPVVDLPPVMQQPQPQPVLQPVQPEPAVAQVAPAATPVSEPALVGVSVQPAAPKDDFEAVMDTVMRDLEKPAAPERPPATMIAPVEELPPREPVDLSLISSLSDLCEQAHAGTSEDYLLLASYYLNQMEYQETFSLKRVNSNLVKSGLTPVNHSVLETVLSKGYLAMVPDMTGTAEVSEYMITSQGLNAVNSLF